MIFEGVTKLLLAALFGFNVYFAAQGNHEINAAVAGFMLFVQIGLINLNLEQRR